MVGLDVTIHSIDDLLYEKIKSFNNDEFFMNRALGLFNKEYDYYLKGKIADFENYIYIIENKDDYSKLVNLKAKLQEYYNIEYLETNDLEHTKEKIELELNGYIKELESLKHKKYNLIDILKGKKASDKLKINQLYNPIDKTGMILDAEDKLNDIKEKMKSIQEDNDDYKLAENAMKELEKKLEKKFIPFNLSEAEDELYINGQYFMVYSLEKLISNEDYYREKLKTLKSDLNIANKYSENAEKKEQVEQINTNEENMLDEEYIEM